mmetsp:Transcript_15191/g.20056  ORF Transcript_15191/g.20056 Transcript_15191/m.20056 type:complete len:126 (-) Transcript_15191:489-866(-)
MDYSEKVENEALQAHFSKPKGSFSAAMVSSTAQAIFRAHTEMCAALDMKRGEAKYELLNVGGDKSLSSFESDKLQEEKRRLKQEMEELKKQVNQLKPGSINNLSSESPTQVLYLRKIRELWTLRH